MNGAHLPLIPVTMGSVLNDCWNLIHVLMTWIPMVQPLLCHRYITLEHLCRQLLTYCILCLSRTPSWVHNLFFLQYCYIRSLMVNWNEFFLWKVLKRAGEYSRDWRSHWNETSIGGCWYWFLFFYFQSIMFNKVENIIVKRWTICWL